MTIEQCTWGDRAVIGTTVSVNMLNRCLYKYTLEEQRRDGLVSNPKQSQWMKRPLLCQINCNTVCAMLNPAFLLNISFWWITNSIVAGFHSISNYYENSSPLNILQIMLWSCLQYSVCSDGCNMSFHCEWWICLQLQKHIIKFKYYIFLFILHVRWLAA